MKFGSLLLIFATVFIVASVVNHIDDTDETYGYWEPLHYLLFGEGMQTWEYSPTYAIRTYSFIFPFYLIGSALKYAGFSKISIFFGLKCLCGLFCGFSATQFVCATKTVCGSAIANLLFLFLLSSPGMFYASTSFLPSALCMSLVMMALANFFYDRHLLTIFWGCVAVLWTGWPFIGVIFAPLGAYMLYDNFSRGGISSIFVVCLEGVLLLFITGFSSLLIDRYYYDKWISPTVNIFLYNAGGNGDNLYGIEPLSYYVKNLLLTNHLIFPLALLFPLLYPFLSREFKSSSSKLKSLVVTCCGYLWIGVLFSRPHKEERFLYPIYPVLSFAASIVFTKLAHDVSRIIVQPRTKTSLFRSFLHSLLIAVCFGLGFSRVMSNYRNFGGYMNSWRYFVDNPTLPAESRWQVCMGGEWYTFPSHFFLPPSFRLDYVKDSFHGQLPQHFGSLNGTFSSPLQPFNDVNEEIDERYVDVNSCDYLICDSDSALLSNESIQSTFAPIHSSSILDSRASPSALARAFYVPFLSEKNVFKQYSVYRRKQLRR